MAYVAEQVRSPAEEFANYSWSSRSIEYHRGSAAPSASASSLAATRTSWPGGWPRRCAQSSSATRRFARRCWSAAARSTSNRPHRRGGPLRVRGAVLPAHCGPARRGDHRRPLGLLESDDTGYGGRGLLGELKADPGPVGRDTLLRETDKLDAVTGLGLPPGLFADASEKSCDRLILTHTSPSVLALEELDWPAVHDGMVVDLTG